MSHAYPHHAHSHETPPLHDPIDAWHDHSHDEKPQQAHAEVGNAGAIMGIAIALFMVIVASVLVVYGYYTWFITERLRKAEIASGQTSPAIQAREYKQTALTNITQGRQNAKSPAHGDLPELTYSFSPIDEKIEQIARMYAPAK